MGRDEVLARIERGRVVAILRGDYRGAEAEIVSVLAEAGIPAVEVTMNSPGAVGSIGTMARSADSRIAVGGGTITNVREVDLVADAGATFIVSPNRDAEVIARTREVGLASFPGCFTTSEIMEALAAGADAAKLFPARMIEPAVVRDLLGPLGPVRLVPTGGVTPERATAYLRAGAWGVGVGSELISADALQPGGMDRLARRAAAFAAAVLV